MTELHIEIRSKQHRRGDAGVPATILRDVRLQLDAGEFVCLVGPSGCGKTTLLNLVAGLDRDYQGSIHIGTATQTALPRIGYVFQNPRLLPWRTVGENIALALPPDTDPDYVEHLLQMVDLAQVLDRHPERLSVGMARRVALVRAFAANPNLLLMDEPFVSLDPPTARRVRELLLRLWEERPHSVLFVTHDLREAVELADRLVFLGSTPATVLSEIPVSLPRSERGEAAVEAFRKELFENHPEIRSLL